MALGIEDPHDFGQWAARQGHLKSQLQVIERQKEGLVVRGERTEVLDREIENLREALGEGHRGEGALGKGALGEGDGDDGDGDRGRAGMNEGILMGRIVKREVIGERD